MANVAQRSFAGGEISPTLYGRVDTAKYQTALRKCRNFFVGRHGGLYNRPGTQFIVEVKDSTKTVRLVKFVFNNDQTYILEFGDRYVRFIKDGAQLEVTGTPYEISTPYDEADLMELQFVQSADVITIVHPDYPPAELSRTGDTSWTLANIVFGASIGSVTNLSATGGVAGANTYYAVTAIDASTGEEGLPAFFTLVGFKPDPGTTVAVTWDALVGASSYRVYRSMDGGTTYELLQDAGGTPSTTADTTWVDDTETASTVGNSGAWVTAAGAVENAVIAGGVGKPYDQRFTFKGVITVSCTLQAAVSGRILLYYSRDAEADVLAGTVHSSGVIGDGVSGGANSEVFTQSIVVPDNGYAALTLKAIPQVWADSADPAETSDCTADFTTVVGYKQIEYAVIGTGFTDDGSDGDPLQSPPRERHLFESTNQYPSAVGIYQQRRLFANSRQEPETVWGSRTGAYKNFLTSIPIEDDDAVTWSMAGKQVNAVKHLLDLQRLIVFTTQAELTVEGDDAGILRPDAINPRKFSRNGTGNLPPLEINDSAVYVQARGTIVRDLKPLQTTDNYESTDLTIYAAHLFNGYTIEDWDYALAPHSIVWAVRSDGTLLGLTYLPEQAIYGWHRHDTAGVIERVCVVPEGAEDRVYVVVRRTIDGGTKRYIERLHSRFYTDIEDAVFMDCALSYDGAPATTFSGLEHLEGEDVVVVADGVVKHNPNNSDYTVKTVSGGQITLASAASVVHVGLPYIADFETLDIDSPSPSIKDRKVLVGKVNLFVAETKGLLAGITAPTDDATNPKEGLQAYTYDNSSPVTDVITVTPETRWNNNGRIFVRQLDPLPVTILAAIPQGYI